MIEATCTTTLEQTSKYCRVRKLVGACIACITVACIEALFEELSKTSSMTTKLKPKLHTKKFKIITMKNDRVTYNELYKYVVIVTYNIM